MFGISGRNTEAGREHAEGRVGSDGGELETIQMAAEKFSEEYCDQ